MPSNAEEHFSVDTQTGQVKLIKSFNSETPTQLTLRIAGKDMGEPPLMGLADIHIELTNDAKFTNENAPEFDDVSSLNAPSPHLFVFSVPIRVLKKLARS